MQRHEYQRVLCRWGVLGKIPTSRLYSAGIAILDQWPRIGCAATNNGGVGAPCPPNLTYPGALNTNPTYDISANLTHVRGRHTLKAGLYMNHSLKAHNINLALGALPFKGEMNFSNDTNNPLDAQFGYANAALGILSSYSQQSKFVEGYYVYWNREWYLRDN
jgi:hypothetical protein